MLELFVRNESLTDHDTLSTFTDAISGVWRHFVSARVWIFRKMSAICELYVCWVDWRNKECSLRGELYLKTYMYA